MEQIISLGIITSLFVFLIKDSLLMHSFRVKILNKLALNIVKGGLIGNISFIINYWLHCVVCLSAVIITPVIILNIDYRYIASIVISTLCYRWTFAINRN